MIFYLTCPEKCIEYKENIAIPSHLEGAAGQVAEISICQALKGQRAMACSPHSIKPYFLKKKEKKKKNIKNVVCCSCH